MFSRAMSPFTPNRSAIDRIRSGRNVPTTQRREKNGKISIYAPSVSIYATCSTYVMMIAGLNAYPSAPSPQHHRSPVVAGPLHSWYVRVVSSLYGTPHKLRRGALLNEGATA